MAWHNLRIRDLLLAFAVALIALFSFRSFFGMQLMEFDAVAKILFHSRTGVGEIFRIFMQPDGPVIYTLFYRPFSSLVWWIIFLFTGLNFTAFHAFNFALHALNSVLVFFLARKLIGDKSGFFSFLAAVVFALHPINLNVVLFVSRMPEMLAAFFVLASLLSLIAFFDRSDKRFFFLSITFCFFGVFSKESGVLVPFVLFFYCIVFLHEKKLSRILRRSVRLCVPFFLSIPLYVALMLFSLGEFAGYINPFSQTSSQVIFSFFRFLFYPIDFLNANFFSEFNSLLEQQPINLLFLISFTVFALFVLWFFSKRDDRPVLFLFYWLFTFLFAFVAFSFVHSWYTYIPLVPFSLLLAAFLERHCKKAKKSWFSAVASSIIALLFLSFILFSPLIAHYRQPLIASELTENVLNQTVQAARELPVQSTLYILNYPLSISSAERGFKYESILINEATVQAYLDFMLPGKKFTAISLTSSDIFAPGLSENQFTFNPKDKGFFLIENTNPKAAQLSVSPEREQKECKEIIVNASEDETVQIIEVIIQEKKPENAFFLFFNGKQVQLIGAGNNKQ